MFMATVHLAFGEDLLFIKGAFEALKEMSENTEEVALFEKAFHLLSQKGLRVLSFGMGRWEDKDPSLWKIQMIGLIGFLDPPKEGIKEAVLAAKGAGIRVLMLDRRSPDNGKGNRKRGRHFHRRRLLSFGERITKTFRCPSL